MQQQVRLSSLEPMSSIMTWICQIQAFCGLWWFASYYISTRCLIGEFSIVISSEKLEDFAVSGVIFCLQLIYCFII